MGEYLAKLLDRIGMVALWSTILYTIAQFFFDSVPSYVLKMIGVLSGFLSGGNWFSPDFTLSDYNNTLGMVNYFFPLDESWAMMVDSVPYILGIISIRWIKSFIPGFSN